MVVIGNLRPIDQFTPTPCQAITRQAGRCPDLPVSLGSYRPPLLLLFLLLFLLFPRLFLLLPAGQIGLDGPPPKGDALFRMSNGSFRNLPAELLLGHHYADEEREDRDDQPENRPDMESLA
jgi:hypothetical protein